MYAKETQPLKTEDLIRAQARDRLCCMFRDTVEMPSFEYSIDAKGLLVRRSPLDKSVQIVEPEGMRKRIM